MIGLEFASIFRSFGTEVTVLEFCPNILPRFDVDLAKRLKQSLSKRGINIEVQAQVTRIDGNTVTYIKKDKEFTVLADKVLMAVGRRPNVDGLNLEAAGIDYRVHAYDGSPGQEKEHRAGVKYPAAPRKGSDSNLRQVRRNNH